MSLPPLVEDLAIDRLASAKQLVRRYGQPVYREIRSLSERGIIAHYAHPQPTGRAINCYYLTPLGAALASNTHKLPLREVPASTGPKAQVFHTLLVGETRHRLHALGHQLISDYSNNVNQWMSGGDQLQPDMYIVENNKPTVAVEVDRGYHPSVIRSKLNDWRERELRVWWFSDGEAQARRLKAHNFQFECAYDFGQLDWQPW